MRDFQEFINEKIAVSCSSAKENIDFVKLCCKNGFKLGRSDCMDRFDKNKLWTAGRIFKDEIFNDNNDKSFLSEYKIVQASEFLQPQATIEIFQSKQTVVCLKKQDGKVVAVGKARCNPEDEFDFDYGAKLAFERMEMDITRRNIVSAGECLARGLKEGIKGAVDALKELSDEMNGIKTLKNGMRIKKQDVYEVGDRVLLKKR